MNIRLYHLVIALLLSLSASSCALLDGLGNSAADAEDAHDLGDAQTPDTNNAVCDLVCDTPPEASCVNPDTLRGFDSTGHCEDNACTYDFVDTTCSQGCEDGACKGEPCAGVVCDQPPSACHESVGTCQNGQCNYGYADDKGCDDGDSCTENDVCQHGQCLGQAIACNTPPASICEDDDRLKVFVANGTCQTNGCNYEEELVTCTDGCENDQCVGDPCQGVVCDSPPNSCYQAPGTCQNGVCNYTYDNGASCDDGDSCTISDQCHNGTCSGSPKSCDEAPAPTCQSADTLLVRVSPGVCGANGECGYETSEQACTHGCDNGACNGNPCQGITCDEPPSDYCQGDTLHTYASGGSCDSAGDCNYAESQTECALGCEAGKCVAGFDTVDAGYKHACGVKSDGTVVCWGSDSDGQAEPPAGTFSQVSAGYEHTCGVKTDGSVVCWGDNTYGEATPPAGTFSQVSAGDTHTCGIKANGTVVCWGKNNTWVSGAPSGTFSQVSAASHHNCGIAIDGSVNCWGKNDSGQSIPPPNSGTFSQVSATDDYTCGVKTDGSVVCWGSDIGGRATPLPGTFSQVSAGGYHTCGVKSDGTVVCWGSDVDGESTPASGTFLQISSGNHYTCGVKTDRSVVCWGLNNFEQASPPAP